MSDIVAKLPLNGLRYLYETNELDGTEYDPYKFWDHCTHTAFPGYSIVAIELTDGHIHRAWILPSWIPGIDIPPEIKVNGRPPAPKTFLVVASSVRADVKSTLLVPDSNWPHYAPVSQKPPKRWHDKFERFLSNKVYTVPGSRWQRFLRWVTNAQ
jgi:hypothetical protein